jgi:hypothetical protein
LYVPPAPAKPTGRNTYSSAWPDEAAPAGVCAAAVMGEIDAATIAQMAVSTARLIHITAIAE